VRKRGKSLKREIPKFKGDNGEEDWSLNQLVQRV
jgi:hypothetical protein